MSRAGAARTAATTSKRPSGVESVVGVDVGSGGCKVTVLDRRGDVSATSYVAYGSFHELPAWVEQDPDQWVKAAYQAVAEALSLLSLQERALVRGVTFSGPHHVAVLLNSQDRPVRRAIMWNDQRSGEQVQYLRANHESLIADINHNSINATWTLAHLAWLRDNEPQVLRKAKRIVYMKDFVRMAFSGGGNVTDYIEGGGTLYWNLSSREWSRELLDLVGFGAVGQPEICTPTTIVGSVSRHASEHTGLPTTAVVFAGTADTAAEIYAAGGTKPGDAVVKLATAGNLQVVTDRIPSSTRPITYEHPIDGYYYVNTATNSAAASLRWFRESVVENIAQEEHGLAPYATTESGVSRVPAGSRGLLFHPYLNGERSPLWDPRQRGSFFGIMPVHDRDHFTRAVMEGVAMSIRHAAQDQEDFPRQVRLVGGGAASATWSQVMADVLGVRVDVPAITDSSAGTALLAATALGWHEDAASAVASTQRILRVHDPDYATAAHYKDLFELYVQYELATREVAHRLADLAL